MTGQELARLVGRLRGMAADEWLGTRTDRKRIAQDAADTLAGFQFAGWSEPGQPPSEVHDDLSDFCLCHHSASGDSVLEVLPVWVHNPKFAVVYSVSPTGDPECSDTWEQVDLFSTYAEAVAADARNDIEAVVERENG